MNRLKQIKPYPFGFFLILEWIFFGAAFFSELPSKFLLHGQLDDGSLFLPILSVFCLIALGLMGLSLPKNKPWHKWLYTFGQLVLLGLPSLFQHFFFIPYLIIVIRSCLIFEKKDRLLVVILIVLVFAGLFALCYPSVEQIQQQTQIGEKIFQEQFAIIKSIDLIRNLFTLGLCSAVVFMLVNALLREYESRQKLALAHQKLREYAMLVEERATLDERNRIAREIHDSVGHALTAQTIQLNNAIAFWQIEPNKAYQFLTEAKELVTTALKEIRHSVSTLRADPLEGKSLKDALDFLIQEFSYRTKIIPLYTNYLSVSLSKEVKLTIYRIVQEALTNIAKHSKAMEVIVNLQTFPKYLRLIIEDNGKGFNPKQNTTGFGLQGMRERVATLGGNIQISSEINCGCNIIITIPHQTPLPIDTNF
ncbi:MAG: sensor histidine kinase [Xenococcaceae cyanobacterium]